MNHIMIDIETMSSESNAAIVSIGAVQFDMQTGDTGKTFYLNVDLQSCIDSGLGLSASTIMWWLKQDKESQTSLFDCPVSLNVALLSFEGWLDDANAIDCQILANSPSFDCVILKNAFNAVGIKLPWNYWDERDCRTLVSFASQIKREMVNDLSHDALSDCKFQVRYCSAIWNSINIAVHKS